MGDVTDFVLKNILYIEELCASAGMDDYNGGKDFCFHANGTLYLGGKHDGNDPTKFEVDEFCTAYFTAAGT